eukprot:1230722-Prymnesium_polylepis.1
MCASGTVCARRASSWRHRVRRFQWFRMAVTDATPANVSSSKSDSASSSCLYVGCSRSTCSRKTACRATRCAMGIFSCGGAGPSLVHAAELCGAASVAKT